MLINTEHTDFIKKNKSIFSIIVIAGLIFGLVLGKLFIPAKTEVVRIAADKNFKTKLENTFKTKSEKSNLKNR